MDIKVNPQKFSKVIRIPASKSHTIRQLLIASLADGVSEILHPLDSLDTRSCLEACRVLGAEIEEQSIEGGVKWVVKGRANFRDRGQGTGDRIFVCERSSNQYDKIGNISPLSLVPCPSSLIIDVGNSGTTLYLALAIAALYDTPIQFTGDESIQKRSAKPLLDALEGVGVYVESNNGCAPITIKGPWKGGKVTLPCPTSQYLSAILMAAPLASEGVITEIEVPLLNEKPYIDMTLSYLKKHGIKFETNFSLDSNSTPYYFVIPGGQTWTPFSSSVPADFSSAAFPAAAAAITGGEATLQGLDPEDTQGDKYFLEILREMGCEIQCTMHNAQCTMEKTVVVSRNKPLKGGTFDLNKTPDLLPAAAAVAAYADGDTAFVNVAHARIKETDRIAVMAQELAKLGVKCTEREDGLIVHGRGRLFAGESVHTSMAETSPTPQSLTPTPYLNGHADHRIVMALAVAALGGQNPVIITDAEAASVTYPGFWDIVLL